MAKSAGTRRLWQTHEEIEKFPILQEQVLAHAVTIGMPAHKKSRKPSKKPAKRAPTKRWSGRVTRQSNALDLDRGVFTWKDPRRIAKSLKHSAEHSHRRKADPYRSALSMLVFYMNRAGRNLPQSRRKILERAKSELRGLFGKAEK